MKIGYRSAWRLFLSLPLIFCLCSPSGAGAADPVESLFPEFGGLVEPFHGRAPGAEVLLYSATQDPFPMGCLALGVKPSLDLIDKTSYSLKLSLPLSKWDGGEDHFLGAGFLASVQLKSLPERFGSWTLSTGFFYIRKDPLSLNEFVHAVNYENAGGMGAINISIIY